MWKNEAHHTIQKCNYVLNQIEEQYTEYTSSLKAEQIPSATNIIENANANQPLPAQLPEL